MLLPFSIILILWKWPLPQYRWQRPFLFHHPCFVGELDCTARGELFDRGRPFLPWLLTTGEYGAPVLAPCEMTGITQRAQLSTQMLTSVLIFRQNNKSQKLNKHFYGILVNIQSILNDLIEICTNCIWNKRFMSSSDNPTSLHHMGAMSS